MNVSAPARHSTAAPVRPERDADWLAAYWMPFTGNREFKADPRLIVEASGAYFTDVDGRKVFVFSQDCVFEATAMVT